MKKILLIILLLATATIVWSNTDKSNSERAEELLNCVLYSVFYEPLDNVEKMIFLQEASDLGNGMASHELAFYYKDKYINKVISLYEKSFEQGHTYSAVELGNIFLHNEKVADKEKAIGYFRKAIDNGLECEQSKDRVIMGDLDEEVDYKEVQKRARKGDLGCQYLVLGKQLDTFYFIDWGKKAAKINEIISKLTKLYEKKYSPAAYSLAEFYKSECRTSLAKPYFIENPSNKALKWYTKAAELGHAEAAYQLGKEYAEYDSVLEIEQDLEQSAKWFKIAANQGHAKAQYELGIYYQFSSLKDYKANPSVRLNQKQKESSKWFFHAARNGNEEAIKRVQSIYYSSISEIMRKEMTEQLNEQREKFDEWLKSNGYL